MMKLHRMQFFTAVAILALLGSFATAGTISPTPAPVPSGPGLGLVSVPAIITANIDNDNQTGGGPADNNVIIPLKRFDNNAYIDIEFSLTPTNGTTEYKFTEFVDNNTGVPWLSYKMQLGTGTGSSFVPFTSGGLDFDFDTYDTPPTSGALPVVALSPYELVFSGGLQTTGAQQYDFRVDVPNAGNSFTLRQIPTAVPEPGTLGLLACVVVGFLSKRRLR